VESPPLLVEPFLLLVGTCSSSLLFYRPIHQLLPGGVDLGCPSFLPFWVSLSYVEAPFLGLSSRDRATRSSSTYKVFFPSLRDLHTLYLPYQRSFNSEEFEGNCFLFSGTRSFFINLLSWRGISLFSLLSLFFPPLFFSLPFLLREKSPPNGKFLLEKLQCVVSFPLFKVWNRIYLPL